MSCFCVQLQHNISFNRKQKGVFCRMAFTRDPYYFSDNYLSTATPLEQLKGKTLDLRMHALNDSQDRLRCDFILFCFFCSFWFVIIVKTVQQRLKDRVYEVKCIFN